LLLGSLSETTAFGVFPDLRGCGRKGPFRPHFCRSDIGLTVSRADVHPKFRKKPRWLPSHVAITLGATGWRRGRRRCMMMV